MPTRTRVMLGAVAAIVGVALVAVGVLGTALDWGADTTRKAVAANRGKQTGEDGGQAGETPAEFLSALATAVREGDVDFQLERLHPAVIERYGEDACRADLVTRTDPTHAFEVTTVRDQPEPFDYASDGLSETIPETVVVDANVTDNGQTQAVTTHLVEVDGEFRYFTDCGTPAAA